MNTVTLLKELLLFEILKLTSEGIGVRASVSLAVRCGGVSGRRHRQAALGYFRRVPTLE
jgi:hypothetical protein